jgi:hypothetical protein
MARNLHARSNPNKSAAFSGSEETCFKMAGLCDVDRPRKPVRQSSKMVWLLLPLLRGCSGLSLRSSGVPS